MLNKIILQILESKSYISPPKVIFPLGPTTWILPLFIIQSPLNPKSEKSENEIVLYSLALVTANSYSSFLPILFL